MEAKITQVESSLKYTFKDKLLCAEAIQMAGSSSAPFRGAFVRIEKNDRLAIVGGNELAAYLSTLWYQHGRDKAIRLSLANWTGIVQSQTTSQALASHGFELCLDNCINLNPGSEFISEKMMAETVKALLAAVFFDAGEEGLATFRKVVETIGLDEHPLLNTQRKT